MAGLRPRFRRVHGQGKFDSIPRMNDLDPRHHRPPSAAVRWPADLHPDTLCFTVDVEWAAPEVLADIAGLFDAHGVKATFFVTHSGVSVPGHERGLHPNFGRNSDAAKRGRELYGDPLAQPEDVVQRRTVEFFL